MENCSDKRCLVRENVYACVMFMKHCCGPAISLQTLSLEGNHLSALPEELGGLSQLGSLGLSFNQFPHIPAVMERLTAVDRLAMAGNRVETLELGFLCRMSHLKIIDLR